MTTALVIVAVPVFSFLAYFLGAESRPDFLDPRTKHGRWI